ncbi:MAG: type VI secretion system contractile sheath large subunit [Acetobacteraceae bacterium]
MKPSTVPPAAQRHDAFATVDRILARIDTAVSAQIDTILHHPRLQKLEGTWRGLNWLVGTVPPGASVRVKLLALPWAELCRDLGRAAAFDQSVLFRKIYEEEFGMPGGEPFGLLVIDHEARHRPSPEAPTDDVGALTALAGVAAAAFVPAVIGASPALLQVDTFADLAISTDLTQPFRSADHVRWRSLAVQEDSRFLAVTLPRMLARAPWGDDPLRTDGFPYRETAFGPEQRVWMNAGYGFAAVAVRAFANNAWPADVRGSETDRLSGGLVAGIPQDPFATDRAWFRPSLEVVFNETQERAIVEASLMPLSALPFGSQAVFSAVRSLQTPARRTGAAANANARLSTQINSMLCVSRFAHCIKLRGRDMVGAFRTAEEIESELHRWLQTYVNTNLGSGHDSRARFPLAGAQVAVREQPGRPGVFGCTVHLQPHFQLDDVAATFRLVTEIVTTNRT